jgi:hypothetical protein
MLLNFSLSPPYPCSLFPYLLSSVPTAAHANTHNNTGNTTAGKRTERASPRGVKIHCGTMVLGTIYLQAVGARTDGIRDAPFPRLVSSTLRRRAFAVSLPSLAVFHCRHPVIHPPTPSHFFSHRRRTSDPRPCAPVQCRRVLPPLLPCYVPDSLRCR